MPSTLGLYSLFYDEDVQLNDQVHLIFKAYIALSLGFSIIVSNFVVIMWSESDAAVWTRPSGPFFLMKRFDQRITELNLVWYIKYCNIKCWSDSVENQ